MIYIENILLCMALPLLLTLFFTPGKVRKYTIFLILGMAACLLSAYVSSFFMAYYGVDTTIASIDITPVCEEIMKLLPILFYFLIFEPKPEELPAAAIVIAAGFATFENVCYLAENGAADFSYMLIRSLSAGALHILCGIVCGFGISYMFRRRFLALTGTIGILGFCVGFHAIYNLLITADGPLRTVGYLFPSLLIVLLFVIRLLLPRLHHSNSDKE